MSKPSEASPQASASKSLSREERATFKWLFWVVGGCIAAVGALLFGIGLFLPNHWNVTREILVHAPPATIHPLVDSWQAWQVWGKDPGDDPTLQYSYSGPEHGVGALRRFSGKYAGTGQSEIVRSDPHIGTAFVSAVRSAANNAQGSISYRPQGGSTSVTWNDQGTIESLFGVFLRANVEDELGKYMDRSLRRLKAAAEERAQAATATPTPAPTAP